MKAVKIKRVDKALPLPIYETEGSVGFDLVCRETTAVPAGQFGRIPANVIVAVPPGYMLIIASRSSTPARYGLIIPNAIGIVDQDYCGEEDELIIQTYNFTGKDTTIERGMKIAQGVFVRISKVEWDETDEMSDESRGGFGSTDEPKGD